MHLRTSLFLVVVFSATVRNTLGLNLTGVIVDKQSVSHVNGALVRAMTSTGSIAGEAMSNDDGSFLLVNLPETQYELSVTAYGYAQEFGCVKVSLTKDTPTRIVLSLARTASLRGTIINAQSEPMVRARVFAFRQNIQSDVANQDFTSTETDDHGTFLYSDLSPGQYSIVAVSSPEAVADDNVFAPSFYPGVTNQTEQQIIELTAGERRILSPIGIDTANNHNIQGSVAGLGGDEWQSTRVQVITSAPLKSTLKTALVEKDGTFSINGVPPGIFNIVVSTGYSAVGPNGPLFDAQSREGTASANTSYGDVTGLGIVLTRREQITITVAAESEGPCSKRSRLILRKVDDASERVLRSANLDLHGSAVFQGLDKGAYLLSTPPRDLCFITSIDGVNSIGPVIAQGSTRVHVILAVKRGSVNGKLLSSQGAVPGAEIAITGADSKQLTDEQATITDTHGVFMFDNLTPGVYQILFSAPSAPAPTPLSESSPRMNIVVTFVTGMVTVVGNNP